MSTCSTVMGQGTVETSLVTSSYTTESTSIAPGSTSTTTQTVLQTSCASATAAGEVPVCSTATSFSTGTLVLPGSTTVVTRTLPTVLTYVSTAPGATRTVCEALPTSSSSSSTSPSPAAPSTSSVRSSVVPSTTVVAAGPSSSTLVITTTLTSLPAESSARASSAAEEAVSTPTSSDSSSSTPTSAPQQFTTSFRTVIVTSIDSSGLTHTYESAVPTVLNSRNSGSGSSNVGAIAGGTVGGVAALVLAVVVLFLMRKKGFFRKGDEEIEDDIWAPKPHSNFVGPVVPGGAGGGGGGGSAEGGSGGGEDKLDALSEKDRAIDAATLERHRSWNWQHQQQLSYHGQGAGGAGGYAPQEVMMMEDDEPGSPYGGMVPLPPRTPSPGPNGALGGYDYAPNGVPSPAEVVGASAVAYGAGGAGPRRSMSNRVSAYSGSSEGHGGYGGSNGYSPQSALNQPLPPMPDHRLSLQYGYFQNFAAPPSSAHAAEYFREELAGGGMYRPHSPQEFQRPRSASPPLLPAQPNDYPPYQQQQQQHLTRQPSIPGLAIPSHLRSESYGSRPTLEAIQHGRTRESSSTSTSTAGPSRGRTNESLSSSSSPQSHTQSLPSTSRPSSSRYPTPPSTAAPTPPVTPSAFDTLSGKSCPTPTPPLPVMPYIERLRATEASYGSSPYGLAAPKRPPMDRAASSDSFIAIPQFLGARIANMDAEQASLSATTDVTDATRSESSLARGAGAEESVDSLGLTKGEAAEVVEREVVVGPQEAR
ncbi:hypothetical protein JCM8547_001857 [Rhodosporidiobolus lusitaniae]